MPSRVLLAIAIGVFAAVLAPPPVAAATERAARLSAQTVCPGAAALQPARAQAATLTCLVNWARARHGRQAVSPSRALRRAARGKAADVIRCRVFSHRPCGRAAAAGVRAAGYGIRSWGENLYLAVGADATPLAAIRAWLASPGHRAVLLRPAFVHVGVAIVPDVRAGGLGPARLTVLQLGAAL